MERYARINNQIDQIFGKQHLKQEDSWWTELSGVTQGQITASCSQTMGLDESFVRLGDSYTHLKSQENAINCYREALRINPGNMMAFNRLLLLPFHLVNEDMEIALNKQRRALNDDQFFETLAVNDTFRQTLIGGYIILSNVVISLPPKKLKLILESIENLDDKYFSKHGTELHDRGLILLDNTSFYWMINRCQESLTGGGNSFPVLIILSREEYRDLKNVLFRA
jgi:tetratricopeptide (TPR) repeat protein